MKAQLLKVKWNNGKTDNGIEFDYTRISLMIPVYTNSRNEFGYDVMEAEYGTAETHNNLLQYKGKLPLDVEVDLIPQKKGNQVINVVSRLVPITKPETK